LLKTVSSSIGWNSSFSGFSGENVQGQISETSNLGVDERPFEAVAALSELTERAYELLGRPFVRQMTPEWLAKALRDLHPLRAQRWAVSDKNAAVASIAPYAALARANRRPRNDDNAFVPLERFLSESIVAGLNLYRDLRDATAEALFFQVYGNLLSLNVADQQRAIRRSAPFDPRTLAAVQQVLDTLDQGSAIDGYVRIGLLVAKAGSGKRKLASMQAVRDLVAPAHLLDDLSEDEFRRLMHEEAIIVEYEADQARRALPKLITSAADRRHAHDLLDGIRRHFKLDERQLALVESIRGLLPVGPRASRARAARRNA
jgi:hypothetical protein